MRVKVDDTIYEVVEKVGDEVCILQIFDYADGIKRQLKIWTKNYKEVKEDDGGINETVYG